MTDNRGTVLEPKQARGHETRRKILDATLSLLEDRHFEALTIADIAARAGMAVGNFYKRFKNKEALLPPLYAEYNNRFAAFAGMQHSLQDADPWRAMVETTVGFFEENRGLIRALHLHSRLKPDLVPEGSTAARGSLYRAAEVLVSPDGITQEQRLLKARMAVLMMVSSTVEAVIYPEMTPAVAAAIGREDFVRELVQALKAYAG
ncbi:MAG: TetR/AcrR family transcriptional regulator [Alphaproteobacteria bacterium]|nr:TetR/AcrR family transcriptional regulator [Alphaproteobacteria bacterium]